MTKEELLKRKAAAEAALKAKNEAKELADLEAETKKLEDEASIEAVEMDEVRLSTAMKGAAKETNFDQFVKANNERLEKIHADLQKKTETKIESDSRFGYKTVETITKAVGSSRKDEVIAFAKDYEKKAAEMAFIAHMMRRPVHTLDRFKDAFGSKWTEKDLDVVHKALSLTGSNAGIDYVLTGWTDQVAIRLMNENPMLANLNLIDTPTNPYRFPIYTAVPTTYYVTEGSTVGSSDPTTDKKDIDCKKLMNRVVYSGELEEDSIVAIRPFVERTMIESLGNSIERNLCFGDTVTTANTNINLIDGTPTTTAGSASDYTAINGLIKETFGSNGKQSDVNSDIVAGFATAVQKMGVGAANMKDLVCAMSVELLFKYMGNSSFKTWDGLGNNATLITGSPGVIFGVPVLMSSGIPKTNSAGKIPSAGGTLGSFVIVKKSGVVVGFRRRPRLDENDILQAADQKAWVASARIDLKVLQPNQSDRAAVSYGYNAGL